MKNANWFEVDRLGLKKLVANKDKAFILNELIQNAWDTNATEVTILLEDCDTRGYSDISIEDNDPNGFSNIAHAYTMFAESEKKDNPDLRGRFNIGEKLVLSVCREATLETVGTTIFFNEDGTRKHLKNDRQEGTLFSAVVRMTDKERELLLSSFHTMISPKGVTTFLNGTPLVSRTPAKSFNIAMPTVGCDDEGNLFSTKRKTEINLYEPLSGEVATIYELGIPVVRMEDDRFHIDIQQKVPLSMDRDNVSASYLRRLRMAVVNVAHDLLTEEDSQRVWVTDATGHPESSSTAVNKVMDLKFGDKRVMYDPSDPESSKRAMSEGYTVVYGRSITPDQHSRVREYGSIESSGLSHGTPKPFSDDGKPLELNQNVTKEMTAVKLMVERLASEALGINITVDFANETRWGCAACFGNNQLIFNVGSVGYNFFNPSNMDEIIDLTIHELGHHYSGDHLSSEYYKALTRIGGKFTQLALTNPEMFSLDTGQ